ncbi:MAG TPA: sporulation protein YqfC, partial [Clostridium sp.]|nr:sporulation protein YqfC [Clostridium sp.]
LFEKEVVKVKSSIAVITILGEDFEIIFVGGSTIVLTGKFKAIEYGENE